MTTLARHVTGQQRAEFIGGSQNHWHHRVGRLQNGLWVATREPIVEKKVYDDLPSLAQLPYYAPRTFDEVVEKLEEYCQRAEYEYLEGKFIVTSFCVGVRYRHNNDYRGLILIEDLRKGRVVKIFDDGDRGEIEGEDRVILFDLTPDDPNNHSARLKSNLISGIKFFALENIIEIN